jgi:Kef-type K+ transport system membrane component KefB
MHLDMRVATKIPVFLLVLIVVALLTKLIGVGLPAFTTHMDPRREDREVLVSGPATLLTGDQLNDILPPSVQ